MQLNKRLKVQEDAVVALRGDAEATLASAEADATALTAQVTAARTELANALAAARELSPEVLHGMKLSIDSQMKAMDAMRKRLADRIATSLVAVAGHKELVTTKLTGLRSRCHAFRNDALKRPAVVMPTVPTLTTVATATMAANAAAASVAHLPAAAAAAAAVAAVPTPGRALAMPVVPASLGRVGDASAYRLPAATALRAGLHNTYDDTAAAAGYGGGGVAGMDALAARSAGKTVMPPPLPAALGGSRVVQKLAFDRGM